MMSTFMHTISTIFPQIDPVYRKPTNLCTILCHTDFHGHLSQRSSRPDPNQQENLNVSHLDLYDYDHTLYIQ